MVKVTGSRYAPLLLASAISVTAVAGYFVGKASNSSPLPARSLPGQHNQAIAAAPSLQFADGSIYSGPLDANQRASGTGSLRWPDGRHYRGQFEAGQFHGRGTLSWANGDLYEGEFVQGQPHGSGHWRYRDGREYQGELQAGTYHGAGRLTLTDGSRYSGAFHAGQFDGLGEFVTAAGIRYQGQFKADAFSGHGSITYADGALHTGFFRDWMAAGQGVYIDSEGNQYRGEFEDDELTGTGTYQGDDGSFYQGEFERGYFNGQGKLYAANGDLYLGEFRYNQPHGTGEWWSGSDPEEHYRGLWRRGKLISASGQLSIYPPAEIAEYALYHQSDQLARALAALEPGIPGKIEVFTLGLALYGAEEVFNRELKFLQQHTAPQLSRAGHTLLLGNSRRNLERFPLATRTSIQQALSALGEQMNPEDILFLYVTSHGSRDGTVSIDQPGLQLDDLSATRLRTLLDEARIPWRVIAISACFSGQFLDPLAAPNTLVMTAAAADRTSFGCSDDSDFTYFGKALLRDGLGEQQAAPALNFVSAFDIAKRQVTLWETTATVTPSQPQLQAGAAILPHLAKWRATDAQVTLERGERPAEN